LSAHRDPRGRSINLAAVEDNEVGELRREGCGQVVAARRKIDLVDYQERVMPGTPFDGILSPARRQ
jgi:hypothetical protein